MSSKPSTPVAQRRYAENEFSRIPISLSPIPFRRTYSMRTRPNCLLNETTLKEHNRNLLVSRTNEDRSHHRPLKFNFNSTRRGSLSMDPKPLANITNGIETDETDEVDISAKLMNGNIRRNSFTKNDRGMVS